MKLKAKQAAIRQAQLLRFNPSEFPPIFDAMKIRIGFSLPVFAFIGLFCFCVAGCGGSNEESESAEKSYVIEPLIGVDTTKPLITPEEEAAMLKRLLLLAFMLLKKVLNILSLWE